jgi:hypothetical protein
MLRFMPDYRRNRVPGGTFFFPVNLLDRHSDLLVTPIDALRNAVSAGARPRRFPHRRLGRASRPHALAVDPAGRRCRLSRSLARDQDRILEINAYQQTAVTRHGQPGRTRHPAAAVLGAFGPATIRTSPLTWTTRISTQSSTVWWNTRRIGRTPRFGGASPVGCIRPRGLAAAASHKKRASGGETKPEGGAAQGGTAALAAHYRVGATARSHTQWLDVNRRRFEAECAALFRPTPPGAYGIGRHAITAIALYACGPFKPVRGARLRFEGVGDA